MLNKIIKFLGIILIGASLFGASAITTYAYYGASVNTDNVTNVTPMNATFSGTMNTGGASANAWFEYGTDLTFGNSTSLNAYIFNSGYGGSFSTNVTGLTANTTYYVRAVALNSYGKVYGNVLTFVTKFSTSGYNNSMSPTAITTDSLVVSSNTAEMNALILTGNTNSANSWFEWGTNANLGNVTTTTPLTGAPAIRHTNTITGLNSGTTYYFRAVAENSYGRTNGTILTFTTTGKTKSVVSNIQNTNTTPINGSSTTTPTITSTDTTTVDNAVNVNQVKDSLAHSLGASVFSSGSFLPNTLLGWMFLLILVLMLVALSRHLHKEFSGAQTAPAQSHHSH